MRFSICLILVHSSPHCLACPQLPPHQALSDIVTTPVNIDTLRGPLTPEHGRNCCSGQACPACSIECGAGCSHTLAPSARGHHADRASAAAPGHPPSHRGSTPGPCSPPVVNVALLAYRILSAGPRHSMHARQGRRGNGHSAVVADEHRHMAADGHTQEEHHQMRAALGVHLAALELVSAFHAHVAGVLQQHAAVQAVQNSALCMAPL